MEKNNRKNKRWRNARLEHASRWRKRKASPSSREDSPHSLESFWSTPSWSACLSCTKLNTCMWSLNILLALTNACIHDRFTVTACGVCKKGRRFVRRWRRVPARFQQTPKRTAMQHRAMQPWVCRWKASCFLLFGTFLISDLQNWLRANNQETRWPKDDWPIGNWLIQIYYQLRLYPLPDSY